MNQRRKIVRSANISIISGFRLALARLGAGFTILRISFNKCHNPVKAIALLNSLIIERLRLHENSGNHKAVRCGSRYYWSINMPGWPSEAFDHFVSNEFKRIHSPASSSLQTIIFGITNVCPLNCIHCYEAENISDHEKLSAEELKMIMARIIENGIRHIQFSGGEPLNRFDDMIGLMKLAGKNSDYWINTSGFGLSQERALKMKENGMTGAVISLDDWDEKKHNDFRQNKKSFYWVQEAVKNCISSGIIVCISVCPVRDFVSEENFDRIHKLAKNMGASFMRILEPRQEGKFTGKDVLLNAMQIETIHKFMFSRNTGSAYKNYPIIQFPGHYSRKHGCLGAGNRYLYIDPAGYFHSCPFCRKPLGNAIKNSISEGAGWARTEGCHAFKQQKLAMNKI